MDIEFDGEKTLNELVEELMEQVGKEKSIRAFCAMDGKWKDYYMEIEVGHMGRDGYDS